MQADRRRRLLEPVIIVGLFMTTAMILPLFFPCTQTDCVIEQVRMALQAEGGMAGATWKSMFAAVGCAVEKP